MPTHTLTNQAKPLLDYDMFSSDIVLQELTQRYDAAGASSLLSSYGKYAGSEEAITWAQQANDNKPVLHTFDRFGDRIDRVEFHPAYHELMKKDIEFGVHCLPWSNPRPGAHVARAGMLFMSFQNEAGHCCPISMTYSVIPSLRQQIDIAASWEPRITSNIYDNRFIPASKKNGLTIGMAMTEKQGGSDLRANTSAAVAAKAGGPGAEYRLTGHKWFCSAPMSDAFLMLAKTENGLSCFLVPRFTPDGHKNNIFIQRLKDKLGNHSNASSEIEFENAYGVLIGEEGRGVVTIIDMVNHTRLDCIIGAAALMRQASLQALHHCHHRSAFGKTIFKHPLMANVLADISLEAEASTRLMMRVTSAYDKQHLSESEQQFKRIGSAIAKYWVCKRAPGQVAEALECFGGNGYVEAGPMPRLFRESPLLGIWEGSGNIMCLDVLRALYKEPETVDAFMSELEAVAGHSKALDAYIATLKMQIISMKKAFVKKDFASLESYELAARRFVERLAIALEAVLMIKQAASFAADAFVASRIEQKAGFAYGTLDSSADNLKQIITRSYMV